MKLVPNLIPSCVSNTCNQAYNYLSAKDHEARAAFNARDFFVSTARIALAAGICFAAYKGSMVAAGVLATASLPATLMAAGVIGLKYGFTALKAGIAAKQIAQIALGFGALYASWQVLDNYQIGASRVKIKFEMASGQVETRAFNSNWGLLDGMRSYTITHLSHIIASVLGYNFPKRAQQ